MNKSLAVLVGGVVLNGCTTSIRVPISPIQPIEDKATVVIYHEQGFTDKFEIFVNEEPSGFVTAGEYLKLELDEGAHTFYTKAGLNVIDRITNMTVEKGKTYFMKVWLDLGTWVSSIRVDKTARVVSYDTKVPNDVAKSLIEAGKVIEN